MRSGSDEEVRPRRRGAKALSRYVEYRVRKALEAQEGIISDIVEAHNSEDVLNLRDELLKLGRQPTLSGDLRIDVPKINFSGLELSGCKIIAPRLSMADFSDADLRNASIVGCHVSGSVSFKDAKIIGLVACVDEAVWMSLTEAQKKDSLLLCIPSHEYFYQYKLAKKFPDVLDQFGICHGLAREYVRKSMKCRASDTEFKFFQKLIAGDSISSFVRRIGDYTRYSYLDVSDGHKHFELKSFSNLFLESIPEDIRSSNYIGIVIIGEIETAGKKTTLNHTVVLERCEDGRYKIYDTNFGRTAPLEESELDRGINALLEKYSPLDTNRVFIVDLAKEVAERGLLLNKNKMDLSNADNPLIGITYYGLKLSTALRSVFILHTLYYSEDIEDMLEAKVFAKRSDIANILYASLISLTLEINDKSILSIKEVKEVVDVDLNRLKARLEGCGIIDKADPTLLTLCEALTSSALPAEISGITLSKSVNALVEKELNNLQDKVFQSMLFYHHDLVKSKIAK